MTPDGLDELYMEIILDHYKHPRNRADLSHLGEEITHENPSCGDVLRLEVKVGADGIIQSARFDGHGCAISTASASLMTERLPGKSVAEAEKLRRELLAVLTGQAPPENLEGDLAVLAGVTQFPLRVKCATLAWHAMEKALKNR